MKNRKGFTLVELIVVMAVLAILVAMGVPKFLGYTKDARATGLITDAKLLESAGYQHALNTDDVFPIGAVYTPAAGSNLAVALATITPVPVVHAIYENQVAPFIRSMSGRVGDFVMTNNGQVFHRNGQINSRGDRVHGIGVTVDLP